MAKQYIGASNASKISNQSITAANSHISVDWKRIWIQMNLSHFKNQKVRKKGADTESICSAEMRGGILRIQCFSLANSYLKDEVYFHDSF